VSDKASLGLKLAGFGNLPGQTRGGSVSATIAQPKIRVIRKFELATGLVGTLANVTHCGAVRPAAVNQDMTRDRQRPRMCENHTASCQTVFAGALKR
jgi:hypothetical protein